MLTFGVNEKRLVVWGLGLFLIGLFQGAFMPFFENPRMALSGHLAAVQSGTALMAFVLVVANTKWSPRLNRFLGNGLITGFYLIWAGITVAAMTGASKVLPHAGQGYESAAFIELIVTGLVITGSIVSLAAVLLLFLGLVKKGTV